MTNHSYIFYHILTRNTEAVFLTTWYVQITKACGGLLVDLHHMSDHRTPSSVFYRYIYIYEGRSKLLILLQQKNGRHRF